MKYEDIIRLEPGENPPNGAFLQHGTYRLDHKIYVPFPVMNPFKRDELKAAVDWLDNGMQPGWMTKRGANRVIFG